MNNKSISATFCMFLLQSYNVFKNAHGEYIASVDHAAKIKNSQTWTKTGCSVYTLGRNPEVSALTITTTTTTYWASFYRPSFKSERIF